MSYTVNILDDDDTSAPPLERLEKNLPSKKPTEHGLTSVRYKDHNLTQK